jgi:tetrahydromethanopterin S-methyltransferase subunit E
MRFIPSFYAHVLNGILTAFAVILVLSNLNGIKNMSTFNMLVIVLLLAIAVGVHGLSHQGLERNYNFFPLGR